MQNEIEGVKALMDLKTCTDYITFDVKGVEGRVRLVGTYRIPWFNGLDVCAVLGYSNSKDALIKHVPSRNKKSLSLLRSELDSTAPNFLGATHLQDLSFNRGKVVYINESGFFRLINRSKTKFADAFQDLVCDYILPTLRTEGSVNMEGIQKRTHKQLEEQAKIIELKDKALEEAQAVAKQAQANVEQERAKAEEAQAKAEEAEAAALEAQDKAARAERSSKWNKTMMKNVRIREQKKEWIYIATTREYAKQRVFKIGSTKRLSKRLSGYQTGRLKKDEYYYAWYCKVYYAEELDNTIQKILDEFKHQKSKEMYQSIKFRDLKEIVNYICINYDKSIDFLNNFVKTRLPASYEEEDTEDDIPQPISPEEIKNDQDELFDVQSMIQDLIQEYLGSIDSSSEGTKDDPIVIQRENLIRMITEGIEEEIGIRTIWYTVKDLISWKSSKTPVEYGGKVYNIQYRTTKEN